MTELQVVADDETCGARVPSVERSARTSCVPGRSVTFVDVVPGHVAAIADLGCGLSIAASVPGPATTLWS
jgi:hypothetical protein